VELGSQRVRAPERKALKSIDQRLEQFVAQFGDVPRAARKLEDYEARDHSNPWIQRLLGEGLACHYVLVYQLQDNWWTFCLDRRHRTEGGDETWVVEAYSSDGLSWRNTFLYDQACDQWRRGASRDRSPHIRDSVISGYPAEI
jgi:hypothetical protein